MKKLTILGTMLVAIIMITGCGGSSGTGTTSSTGGGDSGTGTASVTSLSAVPTLDLSSYDNSTSASANIAALLSESVAAKALLDDASVGLTSKGMGENLGAEGKNSRSLCEANMHKDEIIRASQMAELSICYPKAMETAGFITIPDNTYALYKITPPKMDAVEMGKFCDGIPAEDSEKKAACEAGDGGPKGGVVMKSRLGRFIVDGKSELRVDMCEADLLVDESTYSVNKAIYTMAAVHISTWAGNIEKGAFSTEVDLGAEGYVTNGIPVGYNSVVAESRVDGGSGIGYIAFEGVGSDSSNRVKGAYKGAYKEPYSNTVSSFTGKVYARFGGSTKTGCAKFSFAGSMPGMRVQDMIPFNISQADLNSFLKAFGNDLGIQINSSNYQNITLCPNPAFDPAAAPDPTIKPMKVLTGGETQCPSVTHTGTECSSITNTIVKGDFGNAVKQSYTIIANSSSPYYDEVAAFGLSNLNEEIITPAFSRNWDCTGTFTTIDFSSFTSSQLQTAQAEMEKCNAIQEKAFDNKGMGGNNCGQVQQLNGVADFAKEGGGSAVFGTYGGEYGFLGDVSNTCVTAGQSSGRLFINAVNSDEGKYCIAENGNCYAFTVVGTTGTPDSAITLADGTVVNSFEYTAGTPITVQGNFTQGAACIQMYTLEQPTFTGAPQDGFGAGDGLAPGEQGFIPAPCLKPDGTPVTPAECMAICSDPKNGSACK